MVEQGGTGHKFTAAITVVAGVASLVATFMSIISIFLQLKNYRKPLLQRYVVRILLMVPIYSIASWTSMVSTTAAQFLDPIRDIYEAFTIYTFFQLLINYLGGERALIIMTHGRAPVEHLWPMNHVLAKVDISDPHTFLSIKRGILQYAWLKPILAISAIIMKATGTYQEGYIGLNSGYMWSGIIYNVSVTVSLYSLGLFWVCMHRDLKPFRPVPKFLCVKLIIFASYWQGFFLSILVFLGAIPDVPEYTPDNVAAAIQDALICVEMPIFAIAHWYAFSWQDFADNNILSARMPLRHALRDSFGVRDLVEDSKQTFGGEHYGYRAFDSGDKVMAHEDSKSRLARLRDGMRYERGGKGKYWIPKPGEINSTTPLLGSDGAGPSSNTRPDQINENTHGTFEEPQLDADEDAMYEAARELEFGDWNYPVITASEPLRDRYYSSGSSYNVRSPTYIAPGKYSPAGMSSQSRTPQHTATPEPVVPIKKKKKIRRVVEHEEPDTSKLHLEADTTTPPPQVDKSAGNPAPAAAPEPSPAPAPVSPWDADGAPSDQSKNRLQSEEEEGEAAGYQISQTDEFRNVWGGEGQTK